MQSTTVTSAGAVAGTRTAVLAGMRTAAFAGTRTAVIAGASTGTVAGVVAIALALLIGVAGCTSGAVVRAIVRDGAAGSASSAPASPAGPAPSGPSAPTAPSAGGDLGYSESGFEPVDVQGPVDWTALEACGDGSDGATGWMLVTGFPTGEVDDSGILPFCGDTFVDGADSFVGAVATVSDAEVYLLGGELTAAGFELVGDDLSTSAYGGTGEFVGSREYSRGDESLVVSAYDNGVHPLSLTLFLDYYSAATRQLAATTDT